jgi:hypothetical protein
MPGGGGIMIPAKENPMSESKSVLGWSQATHSCRRRFSEDFKRDAVRLVIEEKYTIAAAAKAVGVSAKSLRDWHALLVHLIPFLVFIARPEKSLIERTVDIIREDSRFRLW